MKLIYRIQNHACRICNNSERTWFRYKFWDFVDKLMDKIKELR